MKKKIFLLAVTAVLTLTLGIFAACGGNGDDNKGKAEEYKITAQNGTDYTVSAPEKAKEGDTVTVTVKITDELKTVKEVKANDTACTAGSEGKYTFTMPAANVTVTVTTGFIQEERLRDAELSWRANAPKQIAKAKEGDESWANQRIYFDFSEDMNLGNGENTVTVTSLNPEIIPQDALSFSLHSSNMGSMVDYGSIEINLGKVALGTAYIAVHAETTSVTPIDATVIKKVEVVNYGEIEVEIWKETLQFDLSSAFDSLEQEYLDDLTIQVYDSDHQYGTESLTKQYEVTSESMEIEIDYVPGHQFNVSVYYHQDPDWPNITEIPLLDTYSGGSSVTGFDMVFVDGILTCKLPDGTIKLTSGSIK